MCYLSDEVNLKLFMTGLRADAKVPGLLHMSMPSFCLKSRWSCTAEPLCHQCAEHLCTPQARILPILASIISHANQNSSILVEGALDVLVSLAKPARPEQAQQMQALVGPHIQALMLHHHDSGILQSCCQYLK